jgi:menaquinone-dependent protoporphyrinogen oxidase
VWQRAQQEGVTVVRICIAYATSEGQTARIAAHVADVVRSHGHQADEVDLKVSGPLSPSGYDGVVVGSSIHLGHHDKRVHDYVREHRDALDRVPSAFFSVSLAAHGDEREAQRYVDEFEEQTGWRPAKVAMFSGALLYTRYGFLKRRMMKRIARDKPGGLGTDVSRDYVYTEWDAVTRFTEDFLAGLGAGRAG